MRVPEVLTALVDQGVIDEVLRPLKSGKEAQVYLVLVDDEPRVAKVYKDAAQRSFKQRAEYTEGRRVRNTRDQRAIDRKTRHGRAQEEEAWKSAEVNFIYRLHEAGVRVPTPYNFIDGVLIMELVRDHDGQPAPRLGELHLDATTARIYFDQLLREVIRMLCAGVVHGDLSDFNVLVDPRGPVVIDFPQSVDAAQNRNARKLLIRDVDNLSAFLARCVPGTRRRPFGEEIWRAYENNELTPEYELKGSFKRSNEKADVGDVLDVIADANFDEQMRREKLGQPGPRPRKREVIITPAQPPQDRNGGGRRRGGGGQGQRSGGQGGQGSGQRSGGQRSGGQGSGGQRSGGQRSGGQGSGGQRPGGQRPGGQRPGGQRPAAQSSASQDGARRDERAEGQRSDPNHSNAGAPRAEGDPPRRRRRRRKPPANANPGGNGSTQGAQEPRPPRPPSSQGSGEGPPRDSTQAAGAGDAPKRRRRRRGRRGKGAGAPPEPVGP